jgi:hypothetical protein
LILKVMGKRVTGAGIMAVGDKTPRYTHGLRSLASLFPQAKFVNIVRHPYDVAVSMLHHAYRVGNDDALTLGAPIHAKLAGNSANAWLNAQSYVEGFIKEQPGRLTQIRYEDLQADGPVVIRGVFEFLGVEADEAMVATVLDAASFEKLSGRKPGDENPRSFFRKGVVGDWKGRLDEAALAVLDERCGELMASEGYQDARTEAAQA